MSDGFVWPPVSLADQPIDTDATDPFERGVEQPNKSERTRWASGVESDLLGLRSLSFARWAAATGWNPDGYGAFCWRCAESVGPHETDGTGCGSCRERKLAWDRAARLSVYDGGLRTAATELKFGRWRRTGTDLGRAIGERLGEVMAAGGFDPEQVILVPVPASWRRRMARGVDHTAVLARAASIRAEVRVVRGLERRHTPTQVGLSATARAANVKGAFRPTPGLQRLCGPTTEDKSGTNGVRAVVLLDDVRTTGATLTAASRAVRKVIGRRAEIWTLVAAVASSRRALSGPEAGPRPGPEESVKHGMRVGSGVGAARDADHEKIAKTFELAV